MLATAHRRRRSPRQRHPDRAGRPAARRRSPAARRAASTSGPGRSAASRCRSGTSRCRASRRCCRSAGPPATTGRWPTTATAARRTAPTSSCGSTASAPDLTGSKTNGVKVVDHVDLSDPDHRVPWTIVNFFTRPRLLTGADFDPGIAATGAGRHVLGRRRVRAVHPARLALRPAARGAGPATGPSLAAEPRPRGGAGHPGDGRAPAACAAVRQRDPVCLARLQHARRRRPGRPASPAGPTRRPAAASRPRAARSSTWRGCTRPASRSSLHRRRPGDHGPAAQARRRRHHQRQLRPALPAGGGVRRQRRRHAG